MTSTPVVVPLGAVRAADVALAGGKGANLGELLHAGFRVPNGFVVTTHAYADALEAAGVDPGRAGPAGDAGSLARLQDAIRGVALPEELAAAIDEAYRSLGEGPVAVRSSATAEDLPGAAFAGQQETFLQVVGADAVRNAVRACWASLWGERAVAYRRRLARAGVPEIAVVVQRMVPASVAGVLFSADPVNGARDRVVIEASPGLGEAVVSGQVTPDHVVLDRRGRVVERRAGRREVVVRARAGGGTTREEGGAAGSTGEDLDLRTLRALAETGRRVAALFGGPQDVEWAYADGTTWLVQARPLTALPPPPRRTNPASRASGALLLELLPTRPYPLDLTAWTGPGWFAILVRMVGEIGGLRLEVEQMLPAQDGVLVEVRPPQPRPTWRTATRALRRWSQARRFDPARWTDDPRFAAYERGLQELRARDCATLTWPELVHRPAEALALLDGFVDLRIDHLPRAMLDVVRLRVLLALRGRSGQFWALAGGAPTETRAANDALDDLATRIRANPGWRQRFTSSTSSSFPDAALVAALEADAELAPPRDAVHAWLAAYGHRETTSAALVSAPTWGDEPTLLLAHLRALVSTPGPVDRSSTRSAPAPAATGRLARAAAAARSAFAFREDSHFHALRVRPVVRAALLEAGTRLVRAGVLEQRDDVLHLQLDELTAAPDPADLDDGQRADLSARVRRRSARRAELGLAPLISPLTLHPRPRRPGADALVSGTPGGGGRATGPVRVVLGPEHFGRLQPGEVLVCPYTNPAWTPLFALAAAVVADAGSAGSHAAIVAREYGIPAVMGTGDGTRVLVDGRRVVVDGDRGVVLAVDTYDTGGPDRG